MRKIYIPGAYVDIAKEKSHPTAYIQDPDTGALLGRQEQGDSQQLQSIKKRGLIVGGRGTTRVFRMNRDYSIFDKGEVIGRTKDVYPKQKNTTLIRNSNGKIVKIAIVSQHTRSKNSKRFPVVKHKRRIR